MASSRRKYPIYQPEQFYKNFPHLDQSVQKVAIFANSGVPVHIAIQPSNRRGVWQSKMGYNIDMEHDLHAIETWDGDDPKSQGYGKVVKFMKLVRRGRRTQPK